MTLDYDYILIGGGPTALTLATYLKGRVALIERHTVLGGCHRILPEPRFVEHGPRVYYGGYVNVARVLKCIGVSWDDAFEKSPYSPERIGDKRWYTAFSWTELLSMGVDFCVMALFNEHLGRDITMKDYCESRGFSERSSRYVDLICRFSDGAGSDRYSLREFLSGFDQHALFPFYVPQRPLAWVFDTWHRALLDRGVDVFLGDAVTAVSAHQVTTASGKTLRATRKVVLCVPPMHAHRLLKASGIKDQRFEKFAKKTKYEPYWSVSFFASGYDIPPPDTEWGVVAVQYPFGVLSAAATLFDVASSVTGVSIRQTSSSDEIAREIRRQLGLPDDVEYAYLSETHPADQAFFAAASRGYYGPSLPCGIDTVGCHNGNSSYGFTSMESAVQNALSYAGESTSDVLTLGGVLRVLVIVTLIKITLRTSCIGA